MFKSSLRKYSLPGLKRWLTFAFVGLICIAFGIALIVKAHPVTFFFNIIWAILSWVADIVPPTVSGIVTIVIGGGFLVFALFMSSKQVLNLVAPDESSLLDTLDRHYMEGKGINVVVIGGGTGLSNMLRGLKMLTSNITAVVTVADDGGSSGRLRDSMNMVPPGDIRNCIAALARDDEVITDLFQYRFEEDASEDLRGHSFGNLFLTALVELGGSKNMADAVKNACSILKTRGQVLPVSNEPMILNAEMSDGTVVQGESNIPEAGAEIKKLFAEEPVPKVLPEVVEKIQEADMIILGPGSLYTSIIPNLLVTEVADAINDSEATKIYICNVMTQPGETDDYSVSDHIAALCQHAPGKKIIDYVIANNAPPDKRQREKYIEKHQMPVSLDHDRIRGFDIKVYETNLLQRGDLVRHNFRKLTKAIANVYLKESKKKRHQSKQKDKALRELTK